MRKLIIHLFIILLFLACGSKKEDKQSQKPPEQDKQEEVVVQQQERVMDEAMEARIREQMPNLDSIMAAEMALLSLGDSIIYFDTVITSDVDSAEYNRVIDSLRAIANQEYKERRQAAIEKADFVNTQYETMWSEASEELQFLTGSRTATQVRTRAHEIHLRAVDLEEQAKQFPEGDPRREALEDQAGFYQNLATRMRAAGGDRLKRQILAGDIAQELREKKESIDITIDY